MKRTMLVVAGCLTGIVVCITGLVVMELRVSDLEQQRQLAKASVTEEQRCELAIAEYYASGHFLVQDPNKDSGGFVRFPTSKQAQALLCGDPAIATPRISLLYSNQPVPVPRSPSPATSPNQVSRN